MTWNSSVAAISHRHVDSHRTSDRSCAFRGFNQREGTANEVANDCLDVRGPVPRRSQRRRAAGCRAADLRCGVVGPPGGRGRPSQLLPDRRRRRQHRRAGGRGRRRGRGRRVGRQRPAVVAAIKRITPKPIRYVIDTGPDADHVGGNEALSKAGETLFPDTHRRPAAGLHGPGGRDPRDRRRPAAHVGGVGSAPAYPAGGVADRDVPLRAQVHVPERRSDRGAAPAGRAHRQRRLRLLPPVGRRGGRRRAGHAAVSRHRRRARREHPGGDRGAQPPVRAGGAVGADRVARSRHHRDPRPRPALRSVRRDRVPGHGHDRPRPRARPRRGRAIARRGQGRRPGQGLRGRATATRAARGRRTGSSRPSTGASSKEKP